MDASNPRRCLPHNQGYGIVLALPLWRELGRLPLPNMVVGITGSRASAARVGKVVVMRTCELYRVRQFLGTWYSCTASGHHVRRWCYVSTPGYTTPGRCVGVLEGVPHPKLHCHDELCDRG